ncbi:MAG: NUDIX hydrolase [Hyphomicrobiaceae bacterium]
MHRIGIIPFDMQDDAVAVLFVTSQTRGRWILPKGRIKPDEGQVEACHREAFEEAGVRGVVLEEFPSTVIIGKKTESGLQSVPVTYYPLLVQEQFDDWPEHSKRQRHWALIEDASKVAYRVDYLNLLQQFQALKPWITEAARPYKAVLQAQLSPAP